MDYRLLVLDIDGTLTNNNREITSHTINTLIRAQQRGIKIVLASGRPTYGIMPVALQLQMDNFGGYLLSFNGGKVVELGSMDVISESTLDISLVPELAKLSKEAGVTILTYQDEFIITENPDDEYVQKEILITQMKSRKVADFASSINFNPDKCLIVGEPSSLETLEALLMERFPDRLNAFRSFPFFLEVVPKGIDKAISLELLLRDIGYKREEVIAIGDGYNDLSMIEYAGMGVAMANAQDSVRAAANFITLSNEEDGVAYAVETLMGLEE